MQIQMFYTIPYKTKQFFFVLIKISIDMSQFCFFLLKISKLPQVKPQGILRKINLILRQAMEHLNLDYRVNNTELGCSNFGILSTKNND